MGLPGIPQPTIFGWTISSHAGYLTLVGFCVCMTLWISYRIVQSPMGRVLKESVRTRSVWKRRAKSRGLQGADCFNWGGHGRAAGVVYAHYVGFIDPTNFTVLESILILSMVIIGGAGSRWGPIIGAIVLVMLPELLRFIGMPNAVAANVRTDSLWHSDGSVYALASARACGRIQL